MNSKGFFGIGIEMGKCKYNYWSLFRTAQILNANFLFIIGSRFKKGSPDTGKSFRHLPVFSYKDFDDFNSHRPYSCELVGVEMTENSVEISKFNHPERAIYLLGAEDHGLTNKALARCNSIVKLHGSFSMNVSVAGSIVLYDRISKGGLNE